MNTLEDFNRFNRENKHIDGSNFELVACDFIENSCSLNDLAYLIKRLSEIYADKLYYMSSTLQSLESLFHLRANNIDENDDVRSLCSKLEDEMVLLNSAYKGEDDDE